MSSTQISHLLPTYARVDLAFERGEGAWLVATNGDRYLDFTSGVAVNALGHAHPHLVEAITKQVHKVWHVFTCWNSTIRHTDPSSSMCIPFLNWLVLTTSATAGHSSERSRAPWGSA